MVRLVAIVGPTGVGKTRLSIDLALAIGGEIINADSRQIYRHMDIGTAKPSKAEQAAVPHHLLDIITPDEEFSLALYKEKALGAVEDISSRGKCPILVGGTGQYVWALVEGWTVPPIAPDIRFRAALEKEGRERGHDMLHRRLMEIDPESAKSIDPRNVRRVIRALEVWHSSGVPFSRWRQKRKPAFDTVIVGLTQPRTELYRGIDLRVDHMVGGGLIDEVSQLRELGYHVDLAPMTGIGYREISSYLENQLDLESAVSRIKYRTHHLARRQYAWFGLDDGRIHWLRSDEHPLDAALALVS